MIVMDYIVKFYNNNKIVEVRKEPVVMGDRIISFVCSDIDKVQLYDSDERYLATYNYFANQGNKIIFKKNKYAICG